MSEESDRRLSLLEFVSRLLEDGKFTSTYKFALLHAMVDCCEERGVDRTAEGLPTIPIDRLASRCIELYWRHTDEYVAPDGRASVVLRQNTGGMAGILSAIQAAQEQGASSRLAKIRQRDSLYSALVVSVGSTLWSMPIPRLQRIGTEMFEVLFPSIQVERRHLVLSAHIDADLSQLAPILRPMIRNAWSAQVQRLNKQVSVHANSLDDFLFGVDRSTLAPWRDALREAQSAKCLYCGGKLAQEFPVDHFVPWARFSIDLGHNLVGACSSCNSAKSDHLAAVQHLSAWSRRNDVRGREIQDFARDKGLLVDPSRTIRIALGCYELAERRRSMTWLGGREMERLNEAWRSHIPTLV